MELLTKATLLVIATQILARMSISAAGKAIPVFGAFIGGGVNYGYIKSIGGAVKSLEFSL